MQTRITSNTDPFNAVFAITKENVEIDFNVIKRCVGVLHEPLQYLLDMSLTSDIFPDILKINRVSTAFISEDLEILIITGPCHFSLVFLKY